MNPIQKPNNPGLSEKAWNQLHKLLALSNLKYAEQIKAARKEREQHAG